MIHKYLAYLKTIETGSITQAAAELGYTQSAVSRMIADLEEHWDVPLLTRNRSGIEISSDCKTASFAWARSPAWRPAGCR